MALKTYIGVDNKARQIKKAYIGVNNIAKRIKKAYIGIDGKARPIWFGNLEYYGVLDTPLSTSRSNMAATTVGNYALFAGGETSTKYVNTVDAFYHSGGSIARKTPEVLTEAKAGLAATTVGNLALFAGGLSGAVPASSVDSYNASLEKSKREDLSRSRYNLAAASVGNIALFAGGQTSANSNDVVATVDAYTSSGTKYANVSSLSTARSRLAAASVGDYALFAGGANGGNSNNILTTVDTFNSSGTRIVTGNASNLDVARSQLAATALGDYVLFAGGLNYSLEKNTTNLVEVYTSSLTKVASTALSASRFNLAAATAGDYVLFAGGEVGGSDPYNNSRVVDAFDLSLIRISDYLIDLPDFTNSFAKPTAATVGKYALFANESLVEAYVAP